MCDLTEQFQQTLNLLRHDHRLQSISQRPQAKQSSEQVARLNAFRDLFTPIRSLYSTVSQLRSVLTQHRKEYINVRNPLDDEESLLTDRQRDELDETFETFQRDLPAMMMNIRLQCAQAVHKLPDQMREHCLNVSILIENFAKKVCSSHAQMKKLRTQRTIDRQKVFRLSTDLPVSSLTVNNDHDSSILRHRLKARTDSQSDSDLDSNRNVNPVAVKSNDLFNSDLNERGLLNNEQESLLSSLTEEEMQAFQEENEQMYDELNALNEEVKKIEGQVVEIAQLQELFTEKVLQQEQELNRLNMTVIGTTENIKGGNQHLRDAMRKNAGFRVWILFFIIGLGFVVLFLDWYNP